VARKRAGEPGILLPPTERYLEPLAPDRREQMQANLEWIRSQPDLFERIADHHRRFRYAFIPGLDPDASLYQTGFWSRADEALCRAFHAASTAEKAAMVERFASPEARSLAQRILFRNFDEELPPPLLRAREHHLQRICRAEPMSDFNGTPRTTPQAAAAEILRLRRVPGGGRDRPPPPERALRLHHPEVHLRPAGPRAQRMTRCRRQALPIGRRARERLLSQLP
jgi:exodeoxyribonuclease I